MASKEIAALIKSPHWRQSKTDEEADAGEINTLKEQLTTAETDETMATTSLFEELARARETDSSKTEPQSETGDQPVSVDRDMIHFHI